MKTRSARYYRSNPLSDTELIVGGLVGVAVLGIGGYFLYSHFSTAGQAAAQAGTNQLTSGAPSAGGVAVQGVDANGNPTINGYPVVSGG
jgi:hypothetical protein